MLLMGVQTIPLRSLLECADAVCPIRILTPTDSLIALTTATRFQIPRKVIAMVMALVMRANWRVVRLIAMGTGGQTHVTLLREVRVI